MDTLKQLSEESVYLDLGFGLTVNDKTGEIDPSSAFNTSLPGINVAGYGKTADGRTKNMVLLAGQIADTLEKEPFDQAEFDRLETDKLNLATQLDNVVNIDMADAITQYSWAQYAYNAALKVGTSILSPSFIDFMK